jgi:tRNA U34 5-carboxymethylaminomethyl modifying GTPase MnmE/TrmE
MTPLSFQLIAVIVTLGFVLALQGRFSRRSWRLAREQLVDIHAVEQLVPRVEFAHFEGRI